MKKIAIIGSTGFIGKQALQIVDKYPEKFKVAALTANKNVDLLVAQAKKYVPDYVGICDEKYYADVKNSLCCTVGCGESALTDAASVDCDIVLVSVVGCVGLKSVLTAIENGKTVALANKESLVAGGALVTSKAVQKGVRIIPVDSEHSAIWQCLMCGEKRNVKRLILTASGGPFYGYPAENLKAVTPQQAVNHPIWRMGQKISVDSATMMNKGLEIIEARWLFDTLDIDYVIHPQSVIHSMVEYADGAVIAQMSAPDMRLPIQLAFTYPERIPSDVAPLPLTGALTFLPPRTDVFVLPEIAKQSIYAGGNASNILNAANEAAVQLFLDNRISFTDIAKLVADTLDDSEIRNETTYDEIYATHTRIYEKLMRDYK